MPNTPHSSWSLSNTMLTSWNTRRKTVSTWARWTSRSKARSISPADSTLPHVRVVEQQGLERACLVERSHGVALHPLVGLLARHALACQLEQHGAGEDDAARPLEVLAHPSRVDHHALHDLREAPQHVVEGDEAVGQDHPLDRRVRDVALVPERDVLHARPSRCRAAAAPAPRPARTRSGSACAASPTSPSGPSRTAPRPRRSRSSAGRGSRARTSRATRPRSPARRAARRGGRAG